MAKSRITDEKRFNLDVSDDLHYYHDYRKVQQFSSRRPMGGGGIVIGEVLVTKVRWK